MAHNPEQDRLTEHEAGNANWKRWGPYLSERARGDRARGLQRRRREIKTCAWASPPITAGSA